MVSNRKLSGNVTYRHELANKVQKATGTYFDEWQLFVLLEYASQGAVHVLAVFPVEVHDRGWSAATQIYTCIKGDHTIDDKPALSIRLMTSGSPPCPASALSDT